MDAQCISNTTRVCLKAMEKHFFLLPHSDEDVRIRSDTGWYKQVLDALNVHVTTGVP